MNYSMYATFTELLRIFWWKSARFWCFLRMRYRQTDQPTDTAYYRDARTHLKMWVKTIFFSHFFYLSTLFFSTLYPNLSFLDASSLLYNRLCPSVGRLVSNAFIKIIESCVFSTEKWCQPNKSSIHEMIYALNNSFIHKKHSFLKNIHS